MRCKKHPKHIATKSFAVALMLCASAGAGVAATEDGNFSVRGIAAQSCGNLRASLADEANASLLRAQLGSWIAGYLSHVNRTTDGVFDVMPILYNAQIARLMEVICAENEDQLVADVFVSFAERLASGSSETESDIIQVQTDNADVRLRESVLQKVQDRLVERGFLDREYADGAYGPRTRGALNSFQAENGMTETGLPDAATLFILFR